MFTIIVVELQRRRAFTLHAVALGSDALAGYSGALPLFVPGKKSPTAEVLVEVGPTARGNEEKVDAKKQDDEVLIVHVAPNDEGTALEEKVDNERPDEEGVLVRRGPGRDRFYQRSLWRCDCAERLGARGVQRSGSLAISGRRHWLSWARAHHKACRARRIHRVGNQSFGPGQQGKSYPLRSRLSAIPSPADAGPGGEALRCESGMRLQEIQCFLSCCCLKTNWVLVYYNSDTSVVPDVRNQEIFNLELAAEWRDFLFDPIAARDLTGGNSEIQVSEFQFWDSTSLEFDLPAQGATAVAWLNSGSSPSGAEPGKAVDGDVTTKWVEQDIQTSPRGICWNAGHCASAHHHQHHNNHFIINKFKYYNDCLLNSQFLDLTGQHRLFGIKRRQYIDIRQRHININCECDVLSHQQHINFHFECHVNVHQQHITFHLECHVNVHQQHINFHFERHFQRTLVAHQHRPQVAHRRSAAATQLHHPDRGCQCHW
eukprot:s10344_g2.t1